MSDAEFLASVYPFSTSFIVFQTIPSSQSSILSFTSLSNAKCRIPSFLPKDSPSASAITHETAK